MKRTNSVIISSLEIAIYFFFILIYPLLFIRYGLDYTDGPFHYLSFSGLKVVPDLRFFYAILGNTWMKISGNYALSYRLLAAILNILTIVIPILLLKNIGCSWKLKFRYMAIGTILLTSLSSNILNWDAFSRFFLSLIFVSSVAYIWNKKNYLIVVIGILTALVCAVRLPSIVVVIPVIAILILKDIYEKTALFSTVLKILAYVAIIAGVYYLLWIIFSRSGNVEIESFEISTFDGGRSVSIKVMKILVERYLRDGLKIFEMVGILSVIYIIWDKTVELKKMILIKYALIAGLFSMYFYFVVLGSSYNWNLSILYSSLILVIVAMLLYGAIKDRDIYSCLVYLFIVMIGFVSALGSDTGLLKIAPTLTFIFPFILCKASVNFTQENKKLFSVIIIVVVLFSFYNKVLIGKAYEDGDISQLTESVNCEKLKYIKTTSLRKKQIEEILNAINEYKQTNGKDTQLYFYGAHSYLLSYITDTKQPYILPFNMKYNQPKQADLMGRYFDSLTVKPLVILIYGYPEFKDASEENVIVEQLRKHSYSLFKQGSNYCVFSPGKIAETY